MSVDKYIKTTAISILLIEVLLLFVTCRQKSETGYPAQLERAIDLFFIENEYESVLKILDNPETVSLPENIRYVKTIFKAASLCETGNIDSAKVVLQEVCPEPLQQRDLYYYNCILGLIKFRSGHYQKAFQVAAGVLESNTYDLRAQALTERMMARIMTYYEQYDHAISMFYRSGEHYRESGLHKSAAVNLKFLASLYAQLGAFTDAVEKIKEAEITLKEYNDRDELFYLYVIGVKTYLSYNSIDTAKYYVKQAMETADFTQDKQMRASIFNHLGTIESFQGNYTAAIASFERVIQIGDDYFGAKRRQAEAYINLASVYNILNNHKKATDCAKHAIEIIDNDVLDNLKYDAYKELFSAFITTDPLKASNYLDSAQVNLEKYNRLSTTETINFIETQLELERAIRKIDILQSDKKRNRLLFYATFTLLLLVSFVFILFSNMRKRLSQALLLLVRKNLTHVNQIQKMNEIINQQHQIINKDSISQLSAEQKESLLFSDFKTWLEKDKKYLQPELDLNMAAREIGTNRSYLSRAINSRGLKFTEIINKYRILETIKIFKDENDQRSEYNLEKIASEVGFNTKSVFFDSFRKETGMTPHQFREYIRYVKFSDVDIIAYQESDSPEM
ncbi:MULTISPECIES: AraC family transcriptional regulator [unclassified Proteiniphilum]|jgi:AraC-like DNA-binding protein/lipopolysaccharide biosynthesis regulator YciM|uniref:AraC family transcriptional regulator n=1 Tax=unclassified Proteiniphilum TaxID=2622718 RepID=UPI00257E62DA|nr:MULTISPECIES: AraC family transcriptional regulator [unclassified Proteiniphilum]